MCLRGFSFVDLQSVAEHSGGRSAAAAGLFTLVMLSAGRVILKFCLDVVHEACLIILKYNEIQMSFYEKDLSERCVSHFYRLLYLSITFASCLPPPHSCSQSMAVWPWMRSFWSPSRWETTWIAADVGYVSRVITWFCCSMTHLFSTVFNVPDPGLELSLWVYLWL